MNNIVETIEYRGYKIDVFADDMAESPDDWGDNERFLIYDHKNFYIQRKGFDGLKIFKNFQNTNIYKGYYTFPVYAYIHSGIALSLGKFRDIDTGGWDTSFRGFALIKKTKGTWTHKQATEAAIGLLEIWSQYLSGEVYGYNTPFDSCGGYYGDIEKSGLMDEAKVSIDYAIKEKTKAHLQKLKTQILNKVPIEYRKPLILTV